MHIADPRQVPVGVYLYTLHPTRLEIMTGGATPDEQMAAARHWVYSQDLLRRGVLVFAGRTLSRDASSFASCIIRAESDEAARRIMEDDPRRGRRRLLGETVSVSTDAHGRLAAGAGHHAIDIRHLTSSLLLSHM